MISPYVLVLAAFAFVIGSVPMHRALGLQDYDSDRQGAVFVRSLSRFLLNVLKGILVVEAGCLLGTGAALATAIGVCYGHNYPFWRTFRGGTGLGVVVGALFALHPLLALIALITWGATLYVFRQRPIAACTAAVMTPYLGSSLTLPFPSAALLPLTALVIWRHRNVLIAALTPGPKETEDAFKNL